MDHLLVIGGEGHHVVGHPADDVTEQPGVQYDLAGFRHIGGDLGADAGLQVVAGDGQLTVGPQQQSLQSRDGALGGHGAAGDSDGALQQGLFAGKFHKVGTSSLVGVL